MKRLVYHLIALFYLGLATTIVNAQELPKLFTEVSTNFIPVELNNYVHNLDSIQTVSKIRIVKFKNILPLIEGNLLHFDLGISNDSIPPLIACTMEVKINATDDYIYKADIPNGDGGIVIIKKPTGLGGFFHYKNRYFDIYPLTETYSILVEHDKPFIAPECKQKSQSTAMDCETNNCAALIKILILITPETKAWFGNNTSNISIFITTVVEKLNYTFERSNIAHRAKAVVRDFSWTPLEEYMCNDVKLFAQDNNVQALRVSENADMVILFQLYKKYTFGGALGCVSEVGPSNNDAYGIVGTEYALGSQHVFVHEVGHLFGAGHDFYITAGLKDELCNYAWKVHNSNSVTVMSTFNNPPVKRILNYSDPEINYGGFPTGHTRSVNIEWPQDHTANNAGRIRATGCQVAEFSPSDEMVVNIEGSNRLCSGTKVYNALISPTSISANTGTAPYTYQWSINQTGLFTPQSPGTPIGNTTEQVVINYNQLQPCTSNFLQVKVTSSDGFTSEFVKRITTYGCSNCSYPSPIAQARSFIDNQDSDDDLFVFPNPSSETVNVKYSSPNQDNTYFYLFDYTGKNINIQKFVNKAKPQNTYSIDVSSLPNGLYLIICVSEGKSHSKTIIINHQ